MTVIFKVEKRVRKDIGRWGETPSGEHCPNSKNPPCPCELAERCLEWTLKETERLVHEGKIKDAILKRLEALEGLTLEGIHSELYRYGVSKLQVQLAVQELLAAKRLKKLVLEV